MGSSEVSVAPASVADLVYAPRYSAPLGGADRSGRASREGRTIRVGFWIRDGRIVRARYRATTCASLIAFAEVACRLLEAGVAPGDLDGPALRTHVRGVHPDHLDRADLVTAAVRAAASSRKENQP